MAGWFTNLIKFIPGNDILASEVDGKLDAISKSLNDHLPEPRTDGVPGFQAPCAVGDPTEEYHAIPVSKALKMDMATDSGVANEYQLTFDVMPTSYTDGMVVWFKPTHANTGPSTAQIGTLGNVPLKKANGSDLSAGDLDIDSYAGFRFNGTEFRAISLLAGDAEDVEESKQWADESKRWAIGVPTEPAEHSAKWWAESVNGLLYMRADVAAQGGIGADAVNSTIDWNDPEVAIAGCSTHYLKGSNPNAPPQAGPNTSLHSFCFEYGHKNGSSQSDIVQLAISEFGDIYVRSRKDGAWTTWDEVINSNYAGDWNLGSTGSLHSDGTVISTYSGDNNTITLGNTKKTVNITGYPIKFYIQNETLWPGIQIYLQSVNDNRVAITPMSDRGGYVGTTTRRYEAVYAYNGTIQTCDERDKDIKDLDNTSWIYNLKPIVYEWKDNPSGTRYGFGAQTTYEIMPDKTANLVQKPEKDNEPWGMQMDQLIPLLLNEMKILRKRIEKLEGK